MKDRSDELQGQPRSESVAPPEPAPHPLLALQRGAGNQATARMLQRLREPAVIENQDGAGLHKYEEVGYGIHSVRSGGLFGTGISQQLADGTLVIVDPARTDQRHMWTEVGGTTGYVKVGNIRRSRRVGTSSYYAVPVQAGRFQIYDMDAGVPVGAPMSDIAEDSVVQSLANAFAAEGATGLMIEKKSELVEALLKSVMLGVLPTPALWALAAGNVGTMQARVATDRAQLIANNLITAQHQLTGVRFTGADFHKGGQSPYFLTFKTANAMAPDERTVVYKPGDLTVDRLVFGRANVTGGVADPSVAESLDPAGGQVSQYTIVAKQDAGGAYGYMEFVRSGGPAVAADLLGVYRSLAANMALSYLVGLEDVHQENVLLLVDRVQVIDMEATTGQFRTQGTGAGLDPTAGGFNAQLWPKAIEGIRARLTARAAEGQLAAVPATGALAALLVAEFTAVLQRAASAGHDAPFDHSKSQLAAAKARVVPVATADFYGLIARAQRTAKHAWDTEVALPDSPIVAQARGLTGNTDAFTRRLLLADGTYNALRRGEVPYYYRRLDDDLLVYDEEDNGFSAAGFAKAGGKIDEQMEGRRNLLQAQGFGAGPGAATANSDAVSVFTAQIVPLIEAMNDFVGQAIPG